VEGYGLLMLKTRKGETMERVEVPLSKLTLAQKLDLMEAIWDDLARQDKTLESPSWHEEVLKDREQALAAGRATISDWEEAKDRIRRNVS
jgi:putative addiction module component (TIGR02574 family)